MRKLGYLLVTPLLVAFMGSPADAQTSLSAGVKAGIDFANWGGDVQGTDSKTGFAGGAFLGVDLHPYFRLQFEGQYVQKGTSDQEEGITLDFKLDYIEFMVPATLTIPIEGSQITPRLYAGPALAVEVSCGLTGDDGSTTVDINCDELSEATEGLLPDLETKSVDFGVFFGGGLDIAIGNGALMLDVLYNLGLTDINDSTAELAGEIKNENIQIMAGYRFFLGR